MLQPATGATPTSLPLIKPTVSIHFLLEQGSDGDRLAAIHAGQRLQPCRVGHRAFDRHQLHAVSQQPDGAGDYQKLVTQFGMKPSMSHRGNCYDNAPMESFWGSLKNELVHHQRYATRADAKAAIQEY